MGFLGKRKLYTNNNGRRELSQFSSSLATSSELKDDDTLLYVDHLKQPSYDRESRFRDLPDVDIPAWISGSDSGERC